jgi:ribosomal protein S11
VKGSYLPFIVHQTINNTIVTTTNASKYITHIRELYAA